MLHPRLLLLINRNPVLLIRQYKLLVTPAPPPEPAKVTVPSGTSIVVRLIDTIDSATAQSGDKFHATLDAPIAIDGDVVVPAHYDVQGHVVNAQASGKFAGQSASGFAA